MSRTAAELRAVRAELATHPAMQPVGRQPGQHGEHAMRPNSLAALEAAQVRLSARAADILSILCANEERGNAPLTARQVLAHFVGQQDPNHVRPRLTELRQAGLIEEAGDVRDGVTDATVATFRAVRVRGQLEMEWTLR